MALAATANNIGSVGASATAGCRAAQSPGAISVPAHTGMPSSANTAA